MTLSFRVVKADRLAMGQEAHRILPRAGAEQPGLDETITERVDQMIARARREAEAILEEAQEEARHQTQQARERGYQEGLAQGLAQSREQWQTILTHMADPLERLNKLGQFADMLHQEEVLSIAGALLVRCFPILLDQAPSSFASYLEAALMELDDEAARLFVSPRWEARLKSLVQDIRPGVGSLTVVVDRMLGDDEWRLESDRGGVLAGPITTLHTLINEVIDGLGEGPFADR